MAEENPFLSYTDRSYEQIKADALDYVALNAPEITDHNETNPLVAIVSVYAAIAEMMNLYIDNVAREQFLSSLRRYVSAVNIAKESDYRIACKQPASVDLVFTFTSSAGNPFSGFTILAGTEVQTSDGVSFYTTQDLTIPASPLSSVNGTVSAINEVAVSGVSIGTSDGTALQTFTLPTDVSSFSVVAIINAIVWANVESLIYEGSTSQSFRQTVNENMQAIIQFGDDVNGAIPTIGDNVIINYNSTNGIDGNVDSNSITNIISAIVPPATFTVSVTNPNAAAGGSNVESLASLKRNIPLLNRTNNRAVTEQDYIDIGNLNPQVAQTSIDYDCGKFVDIYIVPINGGIASSVLLSNITDFYEARRLITTSINVLAAGEIPIVLDINLRVLSSYVQADIITAVETNLQTFFDPSNQKIGGTLHISDIYETIENTTGVANSTINLLVARPYGRPISGSSALVWTREILPASGSNAYWRVVFTTGTSYQLFKDNNFLGTFTTGVLVTQTEVEFTITGTYVLGDQFEFWTYPYAANDLDFTEQSIPIIDLADVTINATGGLI